MLKDADEPETLGRQDIFQDVSEDDDDRGVGEGLGPASLSCGPRRVVELWIIGLWS